MPTFPPYKEGSDYCGTLAVCLEPRGRAVKREDGWSMSPWPLEISGREIGIKNVVIYRMIHFQDPLTFLDFPTKNRTLSA